MEKAKKVEREMKEYCVDLEIAKELKENGFPQASYFLHETTNETFNGENYIKLVEENYEKKGGAYFYYSAPTSDEILKELEGFDIIIKSYDMGMDVEYNVTYDNGDDFFTYSNKILSNALAKMWLYLKKEGYIK